MGFAQVQWVRRLGKRFAGAPAAQAACGVAVPNWHEAATKQASSGLETPTGRFKTCHIAPVSRRARITLDDPAFS